MPYSYIERTYGSDFKPGERVRHTVTKNWGEVLRVKGDPQYYQVRFDGRKHGLPCHPDEITREPK